MYIELKSNNYNNQINHQSQSVVILIMRTILQITELKSYLFNSITSLQCTSTVQIIFLFQVVLPQSIYLYDLLKLASNRDCCADIKFSIFCGYFVVFPRGLMLGAECGAGDKINLHQIDWEIWGICWVMV